MSAPLDARQLVQRLRSPWESPPLEHLATSGRRACVVVDDLARPTQQAQLLPEILNQLEAGGIPAQEITIVAACGTHRPLTHEQLALKVGPDVARRYRVESHDPHGDLATTNIDFGHEPLRLNRTFVEADLKLAVGSVLPHAWTGYSGGAKLVVPGLSDLKAASRCHKFIPLAGRAATSPDNRLRRELQRVALEAGLSYTVNVVPHVSRQAADLVAGDPVAAHHEACHRAAHQFATPVDGPFDLLVLNAYPKDVDLVQSVNALVALRTLSRGIVDPRGVILITSSASDGQGHHGLFSPGGLHKRDPRPHRVLGDKPLWIYCPTVPEADARFLHWQGYPYFNTRRQLVEALHERLGERARVGVVPCATIQQLYCDPARDVALKVAASQETASQFKASKDSALKDSASQKAALSDAASQERDSQSADSRGEAAR
jgi:hypothetical protein